jgi:hypothetical protein
MSVGSTELITSVGSTQPAGAQARALPAPMREIGGGADFAGAGSGE